MTSRAYVTIKNSMGVHLRAASQIVLLCSRFDDVEITLIRPEWCMNLSDGKVLSEAKQSVNGKSIMGVIMFALEQDAEIEIECTGPREEQALRALIELIENGFGEC